MDSSNSTKLEVAHDIFPYLVEYKDGTIERKAGTQQAPPGFDPVTGVTSKDIILVPETGLSARMYTPSTTAATTGSSRKLPLVIYFHGGAFVIASPSEPLYHGFCNTLAASATAVVVSVDYRLFPEHPLTAAFDDAWATLQWVATHDANETVDFSSVFLTGDSAGSTLAHHAVSRVGLSGRVRIRGIALVHPYFWGKDPIGSERADPVRKAMVDKWWEYVCPSDRGCDDPLINPFSDGSPSLDRVSCDKMIVLVAERDILRDRGKLYYDAMVMRRKEVEFFETPGEDHVFYIFDPHCEKAKQLIAKLVSFINN